MTHVLNLAQVKLLWPDWSDLSHVKQVGSTGMPDKLQRGSLIGGLGAPPVTPIVGQQVLSVDSPTGHG